MESLQIAQVLADLSDLQATDPAAASALLSANRDLNPTHVRRKSAASNLPEPPKFDRLGRRIVGPVRSSPALTRMNSAQSASSLASANSSGVSTPTAGAKGPDEVDEDMRRARTLLDLFEQRGKFKQMGDVGLLKSKERVDAVVASYSRKDLELRERAAKAKYQTPPRS